jgi:hypothetical protein
MIVMFLAYAWRIKIEMHLAFHESAVFLLAFQRQIGADFIAPCCSKVDKPAFCY